MKDYNGREIGNISQYDKDLADKNSAFASDVYNYKSGYMDALAKGDTQTAGQMNDKLNASRAYYGGYTGGTDGMDYKKTGNTTAYGNGMSQNSVPAGTGSNASLEMISRSNSYGVGDKYNTWAYDNSPYNSELQKMNGRNVNNSFKYNYKNDDAYKAMESAYNNASDSAMKNALAKASAMTGGVPSTYAVQAATAAGGEVLQNLAAQIPSLRNQAYNEFSDQRNFSQNANQQQFNNLYNLYQTDWGVDQDNEGRSYKAAAFNQDTGYKERAYQDNQADSNYKKMLDEATARAQLTGDYSGLADIYGVPVEDIYRYMLGISNPAYTSVYGSYPQAFYNTSPTSPKSPAPNTTPTAQKGTVTAEGLSLMQNTQNDEELSKSISKALSNGTLSQDEYEKWAGTETYMPGIIRGVYTPKGAKEIVENIERKRG